jgi:hypothetical protein
MNDRHKPEIYYALDFVQVQSGHFLNLLSFIPCSNREQITNETFWYVRRPILAPAIPLERVFNTHEGNAEVRTAGTPLAFNC